MKIKRAIDIDYGHVLPDYCGFCNQIHGHRAKIVATFEGDVNLMLGEGENGMVLDFSICKQIMTEKIADVLDHGFAVWMFDSKNVVIKPPAVAPDTSDGTECSVYAFMTKRNDRYLECYLPPTAEYLAWWAYGEINYGLESYMHTDIVCSEVEWHETPNNVAICNKSDYTKLKEMLLEKSGK
jgi:6-pyruvoyltetrahydropterin/6-carboxytetrahydropterin synthase